VVIELKKGRDGPTTLVCVRADGTRTWGKVARFFPVHDLTHCAVESVLGFNEAFFGLVARGWSIDDFAVPGVAGRLPAEAVWAESIVGLLDLERGTGTEWTAPEFNTALAESLMGQGRPAFRPIAGDVLARTRALRNELQARWEEVLPGGVLTVPFPAGANSVGALFGTIV
jgi:hypothetical protein